MKALLDSLIEDWAQSATHSSQTRAYLLLESWNHNAIAAAIQEDFAAMADSRCAVPDRYFKHREDDAPCLIPLTDAFDISAPDSTPTTQARTALVDWLAHAFEQTAERLARQDLCALAFSDADPASIVRHWVQLGDQKPGTGSGTRLFRYQDPRVMQRVWPTLSASQKQWWLGPVTRWWSLAQPWGPWSACADAPAGWNGVRQAEHDGDATATPASTRALFNDAQWQAAHSAPAGNRIWARYRQGQVPASDQPSGATMDRLLSDGRKLGLADTNLEDYVWCSWRSAATAGEPRERPWHSERGTVLLNQILDALRREPEARFASVYAEAVVRQ